MTRRGRAVVVAFLLLWLAVPAAVLAPASRAEEPGAPPTVVVQPGDTLWSVAERHVPSRDPFGVIEEIRRLNGLGDYTVHAGQRLTLPRRG